MQGIREVPGTKLGTAQISEKREENVQVFTNLKMGEKGRRKEMPFERTGDNLNRLSFI